MKGRKIQNEGGVLQDLKPLERLKFFKEETYPGGGAETLPLLARDKGGGESSRLEISPRIVLCVQDGGSGPSARGREPRGRERDV